MPSINYANLFTECVNSFANCDNTFVDYTKKFDDCTNAFVDLVDTLDKSSSDLYISTSFIFVAIIHGLVNLWIENQYCFDCKIFHLFFIFSIIHLWFLYFIVFIFFLRIKIFLMNPTYILFLIY